MKRIDEVEKNKCCGCTACYAVCPVHAISMVADSHGFYYPIIDESKCVHCELCAKVCISADHQHNGGYLSVYGVKHKDDNVRLNSSSGAAFTAFSDIVLAAGGVVYGCIYDDNIIARHFRADNAKDRDRMRGSKYVQSNMGDTYSSVKQDLEDGRKILFTGTPCQVAGLKSFLQKEYDNLFVIDIVCHGTVSPRIFADHVKMMEGKSGKKVVGYKNRSKVDGWGTHTEEIFYADNSSDHISIFSQAYKNLFYSHMALRPSCYECEFCNLQRVGDLSMCDMWGIDGCLPYFKDKLGVSLVLVNNQKGQKLFDETDALIKAQPTSDTWMQPNMQYPSFQNPRSEEFWNYYLSNGYEKTIAKYCGCNFFCKFKRFVGKFLEMLYLKNVVISIMRFMHLHE